MRRSKLTFDSQGKINHLTVGAIAAAVLILMGGVKAYMQPEAPPEAVAGLTRDVGDLSMAQQSTTMKVREKLKAERQRKALEAIADHEEAIALHFYDEDTPDRLVAVGNLHQYQLGDYYSAIQSYRTMIGTYPDHSKTPQAYIEIAACYKKLGDEVQTRYVYQEMVETLDPSLQHTQYAKLQLEDG